MVERDEVVPVGGRPMDPGPLLESGELSFDLPKGTRLMRIDEARNTLPAIKRLLPILQSLHDEARSLTEELEVLLDGLIPEDPHVVELSDHLAKVVVEWQAGMVALQSTGAVLKGLDPGLIDWYGVVDGEVVHYCWKEGEEDIEWYHSLQAGFGGRRPLVEA